MVSADLPPGGTRAVIAAMPHRLSVFLSRSTEFARQFTHAARRGADRYQGWAEASQQAGSALGIVLLSVISAIIVCGSLAALWFLATIVFAPQLDLFSHIFYFSSTQ